jgi:DNA-binding winged helix-turn-helix (wHTH) protein
VGKKFGEFEFHQDTRQLRRGGDVIPLSPKAFALLDLLLGHAPAAVSKEQILSLVWKGTVVSDASLTNVIAEIRAALEDQPRPPRFIRTVHGFGYAFCGEIANPPRPDVTAGTLWRLLVAGLPFALLPGENVIGRDPDVTVHIDHSLISRRHARIVVDGNGAVVEDLQSRNGTFLNGQQLESPTALHDSDVLGIGPFAVIVERRSIAATTETNRIG